MRTILLIASAFLIHLTPLSAGLIMTVNNGMGTNARAGAMGAPDQDLVFAFPVNMTSYSTSGAEGALATASLNATWNGSTLNTDGSVSVYGTQSNAYSTLDLNIAVDETYTASFTYSYSGNLDSAYFYLRNTSTNQYVYYSTPSFSATLAPGTYRLNLLMRGQNFSPDSQTGSFTTSATFTPGAVPEPSTYALLLSGLALAFVASKKLKRA